MMEKEQFKMQYNLVYSVLSRWTYVFMFIFLNRFISDQGKKRRNSLAIASIFAEDME